MEAHTRHHNLGISGIDVTNNLAFVNDMYLREHLSFI